MIETERKVSYYRKPDDLTLDEWQIALRRQFALKQEFIVKNTKDEKVFSDFLVYNPKTDKEYKVAIRSYDFGLNFCSCPDFKINGLGTCKHIEYVLHQLKQNTENDYEWEKGYHPGYSSISLKYGLERKVFLRIGKDYKSVFESIAKEYFDENHFLREDKFDSFERFLEIAYSLDKNFKVYDDAQDFIINKRDEERRKEKIDQLFPEGIESKGFDNLVNGNLYPYQKEGVLFAAKAGRVLIADDMGLGKTIQAIATIEIWAEHFGVSNVLVIAPTSLKYQWKNEITKFSNRDVKIIEGQLNKRIPQYKSNEFYKIASYGVALNDINHLNAANFDLVILDEAQRIKNWQTKTAQNLKKLKSEFAIVITGTPLENKLEELHSIVEFINPYKLGALFRFLDSHQIKDEVGKVIGYHDLNNINIVLNDILIRRNKSEIINQLPERINKNYFVNITDEQREIHSDYDYTVKRTVSKWRRFGFLSEKDRKILLLSLSCMRMVSDSTYILDQKTRHDKKIDELVIILKEIFENTKDKVVIFSQWERMTRLVSRELKAMNIGFKYLFGGVPSKKRKDLINDFSNDDNIRVFLSTDAGGVGLNLQSANIVINVDLPWNPAVLEQRIGRVHRLGQQKVVRVINLISKYTIEHRILGVIGFKKSIFEGVLDGGEDRVIMEESKFKKLMQTIEDFNDEEIEEYIKEDEEDTVTLEDRKTDALQKDEDDKPSVKQPESTFEKEENTTKQEKENILHGKAAKKQEVDELFNAGFSFFEKMGTTINKLQSGEMSINDFVEKDKETGQTSIKIPVQNEETVVKAINSISNIFNAFLKK